MLSILLCPSAIDYSVAPNLRKTSLQIWRTTSMGLAPPDLFDSKCVGPLGAEEWKPPALLKLYRSWLKKSALTRLNERCWEYIHQTHYESSHMHENDVCDILVMIKDGKAVSWEKARVRIVTLKFCLFFDTGNVDLILEPFRCGRKRRGRVLPSWLHLCP